MTKKQAKRLYKILKKADLHYYNLQRLNNSLNTKNNNFNKLVKTFKSETDLFNKYQTIADSYSNFLKTKLDK